MSFEKTNLHSTHTAKKQQIKLLLKIKSDGKLHKQKYNLPLFCLKKSPGLVKRKIKCELCVTMVTTLTRGDSNKFKLSLNSLLA